jgi:hypothetical protein
MFGANLHEAHCAHQQGVRTMRESGTGYIPGSVWVPWSIAHHNAEEAEAPRDSWLKRFIRRRQPSLYQRCLAMHIMTASDNEPTPLS